MKYFHLVNVLNRNNYAPNQELCLILSEFMNPSNVVTQITSRQQIHHNVKIVSVVKCKVHIGNKIMFEFL